MPLTKLASGPVAPEIVIAAGKRELLYNATLRLVNGVKYGLIGQSAI